MQVFHPKPITGTAPHCRIANNYRQLPADYDLLLQSTGIYMAFTIKDVYRYRRCTDKAGLFTAYKRR